MARLLGIALLCAALPGSAPALTPISQQREVSLEIERTTWVCPLDLQFPYCTGLPPTQVTVENFADSETAPDLADFTATAALPDFPNSSASLASTTSATMLAAQGSRHALSRPLSSVDLVNLQVTQVQDQQLTSSHYEMTFELTETTSYSLQATLSVDTTWFTPDDDASLSLVGPGGGGVASRDLLGSRDCDFSGDLECSLDASVAKTGVLAPGVYTLAAATTASAAGPVRYDDTDFGSFDVSLALAPPVIPLLPPGSAPLLCVLLGAALAATGLCSRPAPTHLSSAR